MSEQKQGRATARSGVVAVLAATLAAGCLHLYLRRYEAEVRGGDMVAVLALSRDTQAGTVLDGSMLDVRQIPVRYLDGGHVPGADLERVEGNRLQVALGAGDALRWTDLGLSESLTQLSTLVPVGRRAVRVDGAQVSFGGLLRPGDRVDVLITEPSRLGEHQPPRTWTLLENVIVLAVGDVVRPDAETFGRRADAVALSVLPAEAQRFESHRRRGTLSLALRNPQDLTLASQEADRGR